MKTQNKTIPASQPKSDPKAIHRHSKVTSNFRMIPHKIAQHPKLSLRAIGLLIHFLSYPQSWIIYMEWVQKNRKIGRRALRAACVELIEAGYLRHVIVQGENNSIIKHLWQVTDEPNQFEEIANSYPAMAKNPPCPKPHPVQNVQLESMDKKKEKENEREDTMPPKGASIAPTARSTNQCNFISSNSFSSSFLSPIPKKYPELETMTEDELRGTGFTEDQF